MLALLATESVTWIIGGSLFIFSSMIATGVALMTFSVACKGISFCLEGHALQRRDVISLFVTFVCYSMMVSSFAGRVNAQKIAELEKKVSALTEKKPE